MVTNNGRVRCKLIEQRKISTSYLGLLAPCVAPSRGGQAGRGGARGARQKHQVGHTARRGSEGDSNGQQEQRRGKEQAHTRNVNLNSIAR